MLSVNGDEARVRCIFELNPIVVEAPIQLFLN